MTTKRTLKQIFDIFIFGLMVLALFSPLVSLVPVAAADVTLMVDTTTDSNESAYQQCTTAPNDCSLRGAISRANADLSNSYTIMLEESETYLLTLIGADEDDNATGDLDLYGRITLIGNINQPRIDGYASDRVLDVKSGAVVTIRNLIVYHGYAMNGGNGGGLLNAGTVTIDSVNFLTNYASSGADGANGSTSTSIRGEDGKNGGAGGAIYNTNVMTIQNSVFSYNLTGKGGEGGDGVSSGHAPGAGGNGGNGGAGGAIYNAGSLKILTSSFVNNSTGDGNMGGMPARTTGYSSKGEAGDGGRGGAIYHSSGSLEIETSYFTGNSTGNGGNGLDFIAGGGSFSRASNGGNGGYGAAIYQKSSNLTVIYSTFYDNETGTGGVGGTGGTYSSTTYPDGNDGLKGKGAVRLYGGTKTLQASLFYDNDVNGDVVGSITTSGYNLIANGDEIDAGVVASDQVGTAGNPLDARVYGFGVVNDTTTPIDYSFYTNSPALNQIPAGEVGCGTSVITDINGNGRPKEYCEIGALEVGTGVPDFTIEKTNDVNGEAIVGEEFEWTYVVKNIGNEFGYIDTGGMIFKDVLPNSADYALKSLSNFNHITNSDKIYCVVDDALSVPELQCSAIESVGIGPDDGQGDFGSFEVVLRVVPQSTAELASSSCKVDWDNLEQESDETNNTCADSVSVFDGNEIEIKGNGAAIVDGDTSASSSDGTDFGIVSSNGGTAENTFTIENSGDKPLNLTTDPRVVISGADASAFSVTTDAAAVINVNSSTTFKIKFEPNSAGVKTALVTVANDDSDEGTYTFAIQGTGADAPEVSFGTETYPSLNATLANGITHLAVEFDSDVKASGDAESANNVNNYLLFASGPNGVFDTVSCAGGVVTDDVSVPINTAVYDDHDESGPFVATLTVNNDVPLSGGDYRLLVCGTTSIYSTAGIKLGDGSDAVLDFNVVEKVEIGIEGNGTEIVDGDTSASVLDGTDFGEVSSSGGTAENTFTIKNDGDTPLNLTTDPRVVISGADASAFSVTTDAAAVINANSSTTFKIEFAPTSAGVKNALVTVANDDLDEGTYTFAIQGTSVDAPQVSFGTETYPSLNATLANEITHLTVEFDSDVRGLGDADSANNVNNYLLFASGPNGVFDTVSCAGGVVTDDVNIPIFSAFYDDHDENGPYVVSLTVNNDVPLSSGSYRLLVCGTTSIHNNLGIELGDGSDAVLDFNVVRSGNAGSTSGGAGLDSDEEMMPGTGLPMVEGIVTLPKQPETAVYAKTEYVLSIPKLDVKMPIVGVPKTMTGWDVTWLAEKAGYLADSAYPTQAGNTVLTGHVWDNLNHAGPFADLKRLAYGDEILITAAGGVYVYEVRESQVIAPNDLDAVFQEETNDWVTLLTCENYQEGLGTYAARRIVRAVLVEVR